MLSAKDIADILGKAQVLAATWLVQGGFVFQAGGQVLSIDDTKGIAVKDLYGGVQLHLPLAGPPFLFGKASSAITPKATVHIGSGDIHQLGSTGQYFVGDTLECYKNGITQTGRACTVGMYLNQKFGGITSGTALEVASIGSHTSGTIPDLHGMSAAAVQNGAGGVTTNLIGIRAAARAYAGTSTYMMGLRSSVTIATGAAITNAYCLYGEIQTATTGAVGSAYGCLFDFSNSGATWTHAFGLYVGFQGDILNRWGFYVADATSKNYLGGWLGIAQSAPINYEKLTVYQSSSVYQYPAVWIYRSGTGLICSHANSLYYMSLCMTSSSGHPYTVFHGKHSVTANVMQNDGSGARGIFIGYAPDSLLNNKAGLMVRANKTVTAAAEFTNYHTYLYIGRVLGLPAMNSTEMAAQSTCPTGAMIYNTTRSAICVHTGGGTWVTLGTTAYTDAHSDTPHEDTHGDAHTDDHGDAGHTDTHGDTPHSDVAHIDDHGDVAHVDTAHVDSHADTHGDHTDSGHSDYHYDSHSDSHADSYSDYHSDVHFDLSIPPPHFDSYSDEHVDFHGDSAHSDTHTDTHFDHDDDVHSDYHTDTHGDTAYSDTAHTDTHADTAHVDVAYVDTHTDSTHTDTHGDTAHEDWHTDHSDAV